MHHQQEELERKYHEREEKKRQKNFEEDDDEDAGNFNGQAKGKGGLNLLGGIGGKAKGSA